MSITASYRRLPPSEFQRLLDDSEAARVMGFYTNESEDWNEDDFEDEDNFEDDGDADNRLLDIQKEWHALHFLLTGRVEMDSTEEPPPLGNVVLGGTPTKWEATYNQVRLLAPNEVRTAASALQAIPEDDLRRRDLGAFTAADLYGYGPHPWNANDLEMLIEVFGQVRDFFVKAADEGDVVLLSSN